MIKRMKWIALALVLLWLTACATTSEAKVNVTNKGELETTVIINSITAQISPGKMETYTISWSGNFTVRPVMYSYPVGQPTRMTSVSLELKNGDELNLEVAFKTN
jgi:uncharacterized protein YcfL